MGAVGRWRYSDAMFGWTIGNQGVAGAGDLVTNEELARAGLSLAWVDERPPDDRDALLDLIVAQRSVE